MRILFGAMIFALVLSVTPALAKGGGWGVVWWSWGGEVMAKIKDFPDTSEFKTADGHFFDAGLIYRQISVYSIPLWNYDVRWAGYIDDYRYVDFDRKELEDIARKAQVSLPDEPELPFWDSYGGKMLVGGLLFVGLLVVIAGWVLKEMEMAMRRRMEQE